MDVTARIRRSMQHYRMDRPMNELRRTRVPRLRPIAVVATTITAAVAITFAVLTLVLPWLESTGREPDWHGGAAACRERTSPFQIPSDWLEPGESSSGIRRHLESLPLIGQQRRGDGGLVVLGDERFVRICFIQETALGSLGNAFVTDTRAAVGDRQLEYLWGSADGGGDQLGGEGPVVEAGLAGTDVGRVEVVREDGSRVAAVLAEGIWVAWWADRVSGSSIEAFDADGGLIGQFGEGVEVQPTPSPPSRDVATDLCLSQIDSVPEEWRLPGEDFNSALERVRALPLLIAHQSTGHYLFGDERFWALCTVEWQEEEQGAGSTWGPLEEPTQAVEVRAGVGSPDPFAPRALALAGTATADVARVVVVLEGGAEVEAEVVDGYWMASWLPTEAGVTIKAYDGSGDLLLETATGP
jgi:hypothetical protein